MLRDCGGGLVGGQNCARDDGIAVVLLPLWKGVIGNGEGCLEDLLGAGRVDYGKE